MFLGCTSTLSFTNDLHYYKIIIYAQIFCLLCRDIGPRSKVWSEKELVDAAAYEFAEVITQHNSFGCWLFFFFVWKKLCF